MAYLCNHLQAWEVWEAWEVLVSGLDVDVDVDVDEVYSLDNLFHPNFYAG
jgi:hypothetical protein